jgi:hypothetical protein
LQRELARRSQADAEEVEATATQTTQGAPPAHRAWTPAGVIAVIGALSASIVTPIVAVITLQRPPTDTSQLVTRAQLAEVSAEIATARKACGDALVEAQAARSQAAGANAVANSAVRKPTARRAAVPPPSPIAETVDSPQYP